MVAECQVELWRKGGGGVWGEVICEEMEGKKREGREERQMGDFAKRRYQRTNRRKRSGGRSMTGRQSAGDSYVVGVGGAQI